MGGRQPPAFGGLDIHQAGLSLAARRRGHVPPFLDPTGLPSTEAHAVTNTGVVVGDGSGNAGQHAFQWDAINGIRAIPGDTTAASRACDVNESGTVVGRAVIDDGMGGFEIPGLVIDSGQL